MSTTAFYREQAKLCQQRAEKTQEADIKLTLLALARDYLQLAEELEKSPDK